MQIHRLTAHPARPARAVRGVSVTVLHLDEGTVLLRWRIEGAEHVVLPRYAGSGRADGLWQTTCLEMFLDLGEGRYRELNFSPSGRWAAYDFSAYRAKQGDADLRDWPQIDVERGTDRIAATVRVPSEALAGALHGTLSAVIEEEGGAISFWSPEHHRDEPDFHDRSCFTIDFAAPEQR